MVIDEWQKLPTTPWLPPGGSWIFGQSALRNRLAKKTDEGQRYLKVSDFPVEWYNSEHLPLIQLHSLTSPSPPLISRNENIGSEVPLFCCDSFPPGEAKRRLREPIPFNVPIHSGNGGWLRVLVIYKLFTHAIVLSTGAQLHRKYSCKSRFRYTPRQKMISFFRRPKAANAAKLF